MPSEPTLLAASLASLPPLQLHEFLDGLSGPELNFLKHDWQFWARASQRPPEGDWTTWLILGGRGAGKTRAGAEWVRSAVNTKRAGNIALVGETYADARDVMVEGTSGLRALGPRHARPRYEVTRRRLLWPSGELQSVDEVGVLAGANLAAIENETGNWEVVQFANADLVGVDTYLLSNFLRGQAGTEVAIQSTLPAGARFVLLNEALKQVSLNVGDRDRDFYWRYGPRAYSFDHETYATQLKNFVGVGARPFSPVHLKARRLENHDIALSWIRRTRIGGDSWSGVEVPLGEDAENYEIDILHEGAVKRTLTSRQASAVYTATEQIADFGGTSFVELTVRVFQVSPSFGRGSAAVANFVL